MKELQNILAILRAQHWMYYGLHWQASKYDLHLLFQRLYETLPKQFDDLAEKMVHDFGPTSVDSVALMKQSLSKLDEWKMDNAVAMALKAETDLQASLKAAYDTLKKSGSISLGMDDYIMALANEHETSLYLLKQINTTSSSLEKKAFVEYVRGLKDGLEKNATVRRTFNVEPARTPKMAIENVAIKNAGNPIDYGTKGNDLGAPVTDGSTLNGKIVTNKPPVVPKVPTATDKVPVIKKPMVR